jgi:hypothetical protein
MDPMLDSDWIATDVTAFGWSSNSRVFNPKAKVTAIDETKRFNRMESRREIRTEAESLFPREMVEPANWPLQGSTMLQGSNYQTVTFRMKPAKLIGATGFHGGTINQSTGEVTGAEEVEGWHDNTKPTIAPIVLNLPKAGFWHQVDINALVTDPNRGFPNWFQYVFIDDEPNAPREMLTLIISNGRLTIGYSGDLVGPITFSLRFFDGWEYSASVPVTINLV